MPHIIVEYSQAAASQIYIRKLLTALHKEAMQIEALPTGGLRTRAHKANRALVGDGAWQNGFVYIIVRIGAGRSTAVKKDIGERLFAILKDHAARCFDKGNPMSLGLEIQEIEKDWTWKHNNIHHILQDAQS